MLVTEIKDSKSSRALTGIFNGASALSMALRKRVDRDFRASDLADPISRTWSRPPVLPDPILQHGIGNFVGLHRGTFWIAIAFPIVVILVGWWHAVPTQNALSAYYFAPLEPLFSDPACKLIAKPGDALYFVYSGSCSRLSADIYIFPVRIVFSGFLCAVAACLYFYKGFDDWENRFLNVAAFGAIGIAVFPQSHEVLNPGWLGYVHLASVAVLFIGVSLVCWYCSELTLQRLPSEIQTQFRGKYAIYSACMLFLSFAGIIIFLVGWQRTPYVLLFFEWAAIWTFGFYWLTKHREMLLHRSIAENLPKVDRR